MSKTKAVKQVFEHLKRISRPETIPALVNSLDGCNKTDVTRALDCLVEEQKVIEKTNNKSKIYYVNQKELRKGAIENVLEVDQKILAESESLKLIENKIKAKESELGVFNGKHSKVELEERRLKLLKTLEQLNSKLESLASKKVEKENKSKKYDFEHVSKECRKRKRITKDIIDGIEEFASKPKKKLLEEIGIEFYK